MKKLENEYRQLMQNETPDLWSRIEAGIDAKIVADNVTNIDTDEIENVVEFEEKKSSGKGKAGVNVWKKYSLPLVACIAVVLCIPLLLTGFIRMAGGSTADTSANTTEMAADCAVPEETTSVTMDYAAADEAVIESVDDTVAESEMAEQESSPVEDLAGVKQVLTVIQISQSVEESGENREKGEIYYLTTEEIGECTLFVPADVGVEFDMEIQLEIRVEPGNEEYDFTFVEVVE